MLMNAHDRLRADLMAAVAARQTAPRRRAGWHRWLPGRGRTPLLATAAVILVAGVAVAATGVLAPGQRVSVPTEHGRASATVVASGVVSGWHWRFAVRPCSGDGIANATLIGRGGVRDGGAFGSCKSAAGRLPLINPTWTWTPGITVIADVVRGEVASEEFHLSRRSRGSDGRVIYRAAGIAVARSQVIPAAALGHVRGARFTVVTRPYAVEFSRVIARDATGRQLRNCTRLECIRLAKGD
jgi:hypothetical protein